MANFSNWKGNEYGYCAGLIRSNGDAYVSSQSIGSYLDCQIASATLDKRLDIVKALQLLKSKWEANRGNV